jgi:hypothetical protein
MASQIQIDVLTPDELAAKLAQVAVDNEAAEKVRLATTNRLASRPKPEPGDRFYVTTSIKPGRSRARCMFLPDRRTEVRVVAFGEPVGPVLEGDKIVAYTVDANCAEMILADPALSMNISTAAEVDTADLRRQLALKDQEIARLTAESRSLREARQAAPASVDGRPERLLAARKAKASEPEFGGRE